MAEAARRFAVVTGANKGIGFEICRQLACNGVTVVLTARDEKRGIVAIEKLIDYRLSEQVVFHPLDVSDPASISSLVDFVRNQFGKLDILVNNAGIIGAITNGEALRASGFINESGQFNQINWREIYTETYELAEDCIKTNYYGSKRMVEAFLPLLELSDSPRIVNISSFSGMLKSIPNEWAKGMLGDAESLTEEKVDEVLNEFLKDFKEGSIELKAWPPILSAYMISKASMNAYTRILAKKYPSFCINCVCPGIVKTDINCNVGILTAEEGAETPVWLALLPNGSPSGLFYTRKEVIPF